MKEKRGTSSLLSKYTLLYEKNPRSRVFAPLAEVYRKLGMIDESFRILKEGIKFHPTYVLGYIVLSHCYYDRGNHEMSYNTLRPFVAKSLENITLQKLFAKVCLELGHLEEALQTFKHILLLNAKDVEVAKNIKLIEDDLLVKQSEVNEDLEEQKNEISNVHTEFLDEDQWIQVDFNAKDETKVMEESPESDIDDWSQNKMALDQFKNEIQNDEIAIQEHSLDDDFFYEDYDISSSDVISAKEDNLVLDEKASVKPIITHTLVDLYCSQGHIEKAKEILKSILEIHPDDIATQKRLEELSLDKQAGKSSREIEDLDEIKTQTESAGLEELTQRVESVKDKNSQLLNLLEEKYSFFQKAIVKKSEEKRIER